MIGFPFFLTFYYIMKIIAFRRMYKNLISGISIGEVHINDDDNKLFEKHIKEIVYDNKYALSHQESIIEILKSENITSDEKRKLEEQHIIFNKNHNK